MNDPSPKQIAARRRNWNIRQLRAYYHLIPPCVSEDVRRTVEKLIDGELERLGAESETDRIVKRGVAVDGEEVL